MTSRAKTFRSEIRSMEWFPFAVKIIELNPVCINPGYPFIRYLISNNILINTWLLERLARSDQPNIPIIWNYAFHIKN